MKYTEADELRSVCEKYSPGKIEDSEVLIRTMYDPEHVHQGRIIETAIPLEDLKERGFSVNRKNYIKRDDLERIVEAQVKKRPEKQEIKLTSCLKCNEIRGITSEDTKVRGFLVVDEIDCNEIPINTAHGAIYSAYRTGKGGLRKLRAMLLGLLSKDMILLEEILDSLDRKEI